MSQDHIYTFLIKILLQHFSVQCRRCCHAWRNYLWPGLYRMDLERQGWWQWKEEIKDLQCLWSKPTSGMNQICQRLKLENVVLIIFHTNGSYASWRRRPSGPCRSDALCENRLNGETKDAPKDGFKIWVWANLFLDMNVFSSFHCH